MSDPNWDDVISLLNFEDGLNDAKDIVYTAGGSAAVVSSPTKFGSGALSVPADTSSWLSANLPVNLATTSVFTLECFVRIDSLPSSAVGIFYYGDPNGNNDRFQIQINSTQDLRAYFQRGAGTGVTLVGETYPLGEYFHVAFVRDGTNFTIYMNGVGASDTYTLNTTERVAYIGSIRSGGQMNGLGGFIDEFRLTVGVARYTSNFNPPTEPFYTGPEEISIDQILSLPLNLVQSLSQKLLQKETIQQNTQIELSLDQRVKQGFLFSDSAKLNLKLTQQVYRSIAGYGPASVLFDEILPIQQISLTFDQLGRPLVFYRVNDDTLKLYWYDPVLQENVTTVIATGIDPQAGFDSPDDTGREYSDAMLFYVRDDQVFMRIQRDRFATEYPCPATQPGLRLISNGLRVDNRYQVVYQYKDDDYVAPVIPDNPVIIIDPDDPDPPDPDPGDTVIVGRGAYNFRRPSLLQTGFLMGPDLEWFNIGFTLKSPLYEFRKNVPGMASGANAFWAHIMGTLITDFSLFLQHVEGAGFMTARTYIRNRDRYHRLDGVSEPVGEWEFQYSPSAVRIIKDGTVIGDFPTGSSKPAPSISVFRNTPLCFAGYNTGFGTVVGQPYTIKGGILHDCWIKTAAGRVDWPVKSSNTSEQPSEPAGFDGTILNHQPQNWQFIQD